MRQVEAICNGVLDAALAETKELVSVVINQRWYLAGGESPMLMHGKVGDPRQLFPTITQQRVLPCRM